MQFPPPPLKSPLARNRKWAFSLGYVDFLLRRLDPSKWPWVLFLGFLGAIAWPRGAPRVYGDESTQTSISHRELFPCLDKRTPPSGRLTSGPLPADGRLEGGERQAGPAAVLSRRRLGSGEDPLPPAEGTLGASRTESIGVAQQLNSVRAAERNQMSAGTTNRSGSPESWRRGGSRSQSPLPMGSTPRPTCRGSTASPSPTRWSTSCPRGRGLPGGEGFWRLPSITSDKLPLPLPLVNVTSRSPRRSTRPSTPTSSTSRRRPWSRPRKAPSSPPSVT